LATVGDRVLGVQTILLGATVGKGKVELVAVGPRASITALTAAALNEEAFSSVTLHEPLGSLKEIIEKNTSFEQMPELFCFGLLEQFDVKQLAALVAPRSLRIVTPGERAKKELADLKKWYAVLGQDHNPLAEK